MIKGNVPNLIGFTPPSGWEIIEIGLRENGSVNVVLRPKEGVVDETVSGQSRGDAHRPGRKSASGIEGILLPPDFVTGGHARKFTDCERVIIYGIAEALREDPQAQFITPTALDHDSGRTVHGELALAAWANQTEESAHKAVNKLAKLGVVLRKRSGRGYAYGLNIKAADNIPERKPRKLHRNRSLPEEGSREAASLETLQPPVKP